MKRLHRYTHFFNVEHRPKVVNFYGDMILS